MASLDVKTASLNADLGEEARPVDGPTEERMVLMLPGAPRVGEKRGAVCDRQGFGLRTAMRPCEK